MAELLVQTKFIAPPLRPVMVSRPRLVKRLDEARRKSHRLALLSAPAGFGKTTLLGEWMNQLGFKAAWLSLEEEDNQPGRFFVYLANSLKVIHPAWANSSTEEWEQVLNAVDDPSSYLVKFVAEIPGEVVIILDDYHWITEPVIHQTLSYLLEHASRGVLLVVATRVDPPFSLHLLRARDQMTELRQQDLCFTTQEMQGFLTLMAGLQCTPEILELLSKKTEGWAAGLQLAAVSMRGRDEKYILRFMQEFSGSNRYIMDYLVEEALGRQAEEIQRFLIHTSILDQLCSSLCDALVGKLPKETGRQGFETSQTILEYLERANLFVTPLDHQRQWYRYHPLFAGLLRQKLNRESHEQIRRLHKSAAEWLVKHDFNMDAIEHALAAGDYEQAANLIEEVAQSVLMRSQTGKLLGWLEALPETLVSSRPILALYYGIGIFLAGQPFEKVIAQLSRADQGISSVMGVSTALRQFMAAFRGESLPEGDSFKPVIQEMQGFGLFFQSIFILLHGLTLFVQGEIEEGYKVLGKAYQLGLQAGNTMTAVMALCQQADIMVWQGNLGMALGLYQQAELLAVDSHGFPLPIAALAYIGLGNIYRERNSLQLAQQYLEKGMALTQEWGAIAKMDGYLSLGQIRIAQKDYDEAHRILLDAQQLAIRFDTTFIDDAYVELQIVRLWMAQGNLAAVSQWMVAHGLTYELAQKTLQRDETNDSFFEVYLQEMKILALVQFLTLQGCYEQVIDLSEPLLSRLEAQKLKTSLIELLLLRSAAFYKLGLKDDALECFGCVLTLADAEKYCQIFLNIEDHLISLLDLYRHSYPDQHRDYLGYLYQHYGAKGELTVTGMEMPGSTTHMTGAGRHWIEPLSKRELEILRLLVRGLSNEEIASQLVVAVSTVKTHINHIYRKLGAANRTGAAAIAREAGLL